MKVSSLLVLTLLVVAELAVSANAAYRKSDAPVADKKKEETFSDSEEDETESTTIKEGEEMMVALWEDSYLLPESKRCSVGRFVDGKFQGAEYDLLKILKKYGGPPGKVNATWSKKEDAAVNKEDLAKRPLPDADQKYWLYKYGDTDGKTYIRIEHAVRRFSGTPKSFLEVRGILYFTPEEFCGKSRRAYYTVDDRGFTFEVTDEFCKIGSTVKCAPLATCRTDEQGRVASCGLATHELLLSSLVGGGK